MKKVQIKKALLPLSVLGVLMIIYLGFRFFGMPPKEDLLNMASELFNRYGLIILLVSSIIEGLVLIGWYYPGSLVIFLGVILAGHDLTKIFFTVGTISIGLFFAYVINFFLGKYGWYRLLLRFGLKEALDDARERVQKHGLKAIFLSYWQPNLGALVATSAGILNLSFKKFFFYSIFATLLWNSFWATLVYFIGDKALDLVGLRFLLLVIFAWIVYRIWKPQKEDEGDIDVPTP